MKKNHRLRFVFQLCKELGIDDPICWFNRVPPHVVDWWLAFYLVQSEELEAASDSGKQKMDPMKAYEALSRQYG